MVYLWSCLWLACMTRSPRCYQTNFWTPLGSCSEAGSWRSGWFCCRPWSRWCWWRGHWADWFRLDRWTPGFPWCWLSAEGKGGVRFIIHRQRHKGVESGWCLLGRKIFITNTTRHTLPPSESKVRNQRCRDGYKIWFITRPLPHTRPPHPSSSLAPCLWSCRCHSPFSLLFPSPPPLSSRVKRHYIIMQEWIIVMVVCESGESGLGSEGWQGSRWQTKGRATTLNGCCAPSRWDMFQFGDKSCDYTCIAFDFSLRFLCSKTENWCWCLCIPVLLWTTACCLN